MLVVEDDASTHTALRILLGKRGWDVVTATTLAAAFGALQQFDNDPPQAVILDLMLPDGDGAALLRQIRKRNHKSRVVITTGVMDPARLLALDDLTPDAILRKPINLIELLRAIA